MAKIKKVEKIKKNLSNETRQIDIEFIKSGFKKKVDLEEFESLEKRVIRLEKLLQVQFQK